MRLHGFSRSERDQVHPTICQSRVLLSVMLLSRRLLVHLPVLLCPLSWEQIQVQEPNRRQSLET